MKQEKDSELYIIALINVLDILENEILVDSFVQ
jgi:hypothetical protein